MAQTGYTPISLYYSTTASTAPTAGNLVAGELAINTTDGKLYYKDTAGVVQVIGTKGGVGSSSTTQVLYNSSGLVVGSANMTFNGTALTLANDASISGLTVGKGGGAEVNSSAFGVSALSSQTSGGYNSAIGYQALYLNTGGFSNSALGHSALKANTTGNDNSALGANALLSNTTGASNTGIGRGSLQNNTTASNNTAVGYQAGYSNVTGAESTYIGQGAGYSTTGGTNTFVGYVAGYNSTTGTRNTYVGWGAGYVMTTGAKNTILGGFQGNYGGLDIRTASNYIVLSDGDGNPRGVFDGSGNYMLGTGAARTGTSSLTFEPANSFFQMRASGTASLTQVQFIRDSAGTPVSVGTINTTGSATAYNTSSDYRLKENIAPMTGALSKVAQLKPVTYKWKSTGEESQGFIAHELAEVVPECVTGEKDAVDKEGNPIYQGIDVSFLVATLTSAIKELKAEVDSLKQQLGK